MDIQEPIARTDELMARLVEEEARARELLEEAGRALRASDILAARRAHRSHLERLQRITVLELALERARKLEKHA